MATWCSRTQKFKQLNPSWFRHLPGAFKHNLRRSLFATSFSSIRNHHRLVSSSEPSPKLWRRRDRGMGRAVDSNCMRTLGSCTESSAGVPVEATGGATAATRPWAHRHERPVPRRHMTVQQMIPTAASVGMSPASRKSGLQSAIFEVYPFGMQRSPH